MIQSAEDLADLLRHAVTHDTGGEALASGIRKAAFVEPPTWRFGVETIEGRRFDVTITEGT